MWRQLPSLSHAGFNPSVFLYALDGKSFPDRPRPATCLGPYSAVTLTPEARMGSSIVSGLAFFLFIAGVLIYAVILYNGLVRLRNENDRAWANIDVLLKQRHDEIPNLVETVKGYMQHEQQTLLAVTQARAASMNAASIGQKAVAELQVATALRGLFAVAENYPQLKANENFLKLQNRITELEERIADRREFFNDDVNTYNTRIGQIPDVFVASPMGLQRREMFKVSEENRRQVEVSFQQA
ncbi:MAG TPA: LemA family protein [Candidatus Sulfotelmatobacter sp.]|nr:LemA family protein [Candidatus Sulfotelmatobacter sp.]